MARQEFYIGTQGPFFYDDTRQYRDTTNVKTLRTSHQLQVDTAPATNTEVVRLYDLNVSLDQIVNRIAALSDVDLTSVNSTLIFEASVGWLVTAMRIVVTAANTVTSMPTIKLNTASDDLIPAMSPFGLTAIGRVWSWDSRGAGRVLAAGEDVNFTVLTGAGASSLTADVIVYGVKSL